MNCRNKVSIHHIFEFLALINLKKICIIIQNLNNKLTSFHFFNFHFLSLQAWNETLKLFCNFNYLPRWKLTVLIIEIQSFGLSKNFVFGYKNIEKEKFILNYLLLCLLFWVSSNLMNKLVVSLHLTFTEISWFSAEILIFFSLMDRVMVATVLGTCSISDIACKNFCYLYIKFLLLFMAIIEI